MTNSNLLGVLHGKVFKINASMMRIWRFKWLTADHPEQSLRRWCSLDHGPWISLQCQGTKPKSAGNAPWGGHSTRKTNMFQMLSDKYTVCRTELRVGISIPRY